MAIMALRIRVESLAKEIDEVQEMLSFWQGRLNDGALMEGMTNEMQEDVFVYQLRGELHLCAAKLASLVEVMEG